MFLCFVFFCHRMKIQFANVPECFRPSYTIKLGLPTPWISTLKLNTKFQMWQEFLCTKQHPPCSAFSPLTLPSLKRSAYFFVPSKSRLYYQAKQFNKLIKFRKHSPKIHPPPDSVTHGLLCWLFTSIDDRFLVLVLTDFVNPRPPCWLFLS